MELKKATDIAIDIWKELKDHCEPGHCKIAGSIRREKPEVKDIEIVALPKTDDLKDLFENVIGKQRLPGWLKAVLELGNPAKGSASGKYMQIEIKELFINLDLFMPDDFDYWRQFAIRTGSAEWTARFIAGGWRNIGWCGTDVGLRMISECHGTKGPTIKQNGSALLQHQSKHFRHIGKVSKSFSIG